MTDKIPNLLYYIFFGLTAIVTVWRFVRTNEAKALRPKQLLSSWQPLLMAVVPIVGVLCSSNIADVPLASTAPYFAGAATIMWFLSQIGLAGEIRSLILLMMAVGLGLTITAENPLNLVAAMGGLLTWKLIENLMHKPESRLDDVNAPFVWLTTVYWAMTLQGSNPEHIALAQALVLAMLTSSVFIRWAQPILIPNDTIYLKRVMLSATGALAFLILVTKVIVHAELYKMVALAAVAFLVTYLLQSLDKNVDDNPILSRGIKNILLVGICTLAASRIFGMEGLLILAAATVVAPIPGSALIAGLFWSSRALLQSYVTQFNPNVTGVNLMHNYASAALYAGFLVVILASVLIKDQHDRKVLSGGLITALIVLAAGSNYFLHAEPTGSLLISLSVIGILVAYLAPVLFPGRAADQENLMLLPALATTTALLASGFIDKGNDATNEQRMIALCVIAALVAIFAVLSAKTSAKSGNGKPEAPTPEAA